MPSEAERRELFVALEESLGSVPAATLMEFLRPVGWGDVARRSDVEALRSEWRGEIAELRAEVRSEMAELRARVDGLAVRQLLANIPLAFGVAGLVLAAAKLA